MDGNGGGYLHTELTRETQSPPRSNMELPLDQEPCRECSAAQRCATLLLACQQFVGFVETGSSDVSNDFQRRPTRKIFNRLFSDPDARESASSHPASHSSLAT